MNLQHRIQKNYLPDSSATSFFLQVTVGSLRSQKEKNVGKSVEPRKTMTVRKSLSDEGSYSETQRVARTVIFGGLLNADMTEDVHRQAKECGTVSFVTYPLSKDELEHHGRSLMVGV